jgi:hypothetical protein
MRAAQLWKEIFHTMIPTKLEIYGIAFVVLALALAAGGFYEHHQGYLAGKKEVQAEFDAFKNEVKAAGLKAEQDKLAKEKQDAEKITAAVASRDAALNSLRIAAARPRGGFVPSAAPGAADGGRICYDRQALDAALRRLDSGVSGLITEGDGQVINALSLLRAWPSGGSAGLKPPQTR